MHAPKMHARTVRPWFELTRHKDPDPAPVPDPVPEPDPAPPADPVYPDGLGDAGKQALDNERTARREAERARKEAERIVADQAARLKEIDDRDKTELQRAQDAATAANERANTAERTALRLSIVSELNVPADLAEFVVGADEQAMRDAAAKLTKAVAAAGPRVPAPDPGQGPKPDAPLDYRTASKEDIDAEKRRRGIRTF